MLIFASDANPFIGVIPNPLSDAKWVRNLLVPTNQQVPRCLASLDPSE